MAYSEPLAARVREVLSEAGDLREQKMFGGLAFLVGGHMCCGIVGDDLMLRLGAAALAALDEPHTRPMDFTGRPLKSMVFVGPAGTRRAADLRAWVERARAFVETLPARPRLSGAGSARPRSAGPAGGPTRRASARAARRRP